MIVAEYYMAADDDYNRHPCKARTLRAAKREASAYYDDRAFGTVITITTAGVETPRRELAKKAIGGRWYHPD